MCRLFGGHPKFMATGVHQAIATVIVVFLASRFSMAAEIMVYVSLFFRQTIVARNAWMPNWSIILKCGNAAATMP